MDWSQVNANGLTKLHLKKKQEIYCIGWKTRAKNCQEIDMQATLFLLLIKMKLLLSIMNIESTLILNRHNIKEETY